MIILINNYYKPTLPSHIYKTKKFDANTQTQHACHKKMINKDKKIINPGSLLKYSNVYYYY